MFSKKSKKVLLGISCLVIILNYSCRKETVPIAAENNTSSTTSSSVSDNYLSMADFFKKNEVPMQTFMIKAENGATLKGTQGTVFKIPANAFVRNGVVVKGDVKIEVKEIYKKSDMLLSDKPTLMASDFYKNSGAGFPPILLKSGGEFFIKATPVSIDTAKVKLQVPIVVEMPALQPDSGMIAFVQNPNADQFNWVPDTTNFVEASAGMYVYNLFQFSGSQGGGTWCNSDNPNYFPANHQIHVKFENSTTFSPYDMEVFLVFKTNCMVHVYPETSDFPYEYAPDNEKCTVVAVATKDGKLHASFQEVTLVAGGIYQITLSPTTTAEFKKKLNDLN